MVYRIEVTDPIPQTTISKRWFPTEKAAWNWVEEHENPLLDYDVLAYRDEYSTIPCDKTEGRK